MKIAYISHFGRPCYEYQWFSHMDADKIKFIDVDFSSYPGSHPDKVEYCPVDYEENNLLKDRFHSTARVIRYQNFEKYLEDVDVVIVLEVFSSLSKQFVKYCKANRKKVVVLVYELISTHPLHYLPTHIFNRLYTIRHADLFVCVSEKAKESLVKLGAVEAKVEVVYPGIDLTLFKPNSSTETSRNLIFVGGLKPHKGIDLVLEMADKVLPKYPNAILTMVGDGPYRDQVGEYTKKYSNMKYLGKVDNNQLPEILNKHGILVMPCRDVSKYGIKITSEQFGFSFVEAMACGLAVVTADCGAIPEIVTNRNIIGPQGDADTFTAGIMGLLDESEKLHKLQEYNAKLVKIRYDVVQQGKALTEVITVGNKH